MISIRALVGSASSSGFSVTDEAETGVLTPADQADWSDNKLCVFQAGAAPTNLRVL